MALNICTVENGARIHRWSSQSNSKHAPAENILREDRSVEMSLTAVDMDKLGWNAAIFGYRHPKSKEAAEVDSMGGIRLVA